MLAFQIILTIIVVSGFIAFIGDRVGHFIGRKRLTIFNLRPRYTAISITVVSGILIALFTASILFMASADVRTAVFGLNKLKNLIKERSRELEKIKSGREDLVKEVAELDLKLEESKKEIVDLQKTKISLTKEINTARSGSMLYRVNDVITSVVIDSSPNLETNRQKLAEILSTTDSAIKKIVGKNKNHYIEMPELELDEASDFMLKHQGKIIARVVSARNAVFGESIPVHFELFENIPVFKKNEIIISASINGKSTLPQIEQKIKEALSQVNNIAIEKGLIPGIDGSVGVIPYAKIFDTSKKIKAENKNIYLKVVSVNDTTSAGPLVIDLEIKN